MITPKTCLSLLTILLVFTAHSQKQLQITYENHSYNFSNVKSSVVKVICTRDACLSTTEDLWESSNYNFTNDTYENTSEIVETFVYKNHTNNMLYFYEDQLLEFYVEEPLTQFNWEVGKKTMHILGYKCTEAKTHYRGRDYIAWFTTDLPYKAAPWKFHGLPGVILKVKSKDDFVDMEAIELKLKEGDEPKNPFKGKTFITNKEFEKKYRSKIVKDRGSMKAMDVRNGGNYIPTIRPRAEIIVEENGMTVEDLQKLMQ